jgi:hypothetical protein
MHRACCYKLALSRATFLLATCRYGNRINFAQLVLGAKIWRGPRGDSGLDWTTPTFVQPSSSIEDAYLRSVTSVRPCVRVRARMHVRMRVYHLSSL